MRGLFRVWGRNLSVKFDTYGKTAMGRRCGEAQCPDEQNMGTGAGAGVPHIDLGT